MESRTTRRETILALGATAVVAATGRMARAGADDKAALPALLPAGKHAAVPLPFEAASLAGLSAKMITSHWQNNYGGAVKNLNKVEEQLATVTSALPQARTSMALLGLPAHSQQI
ncbi:MAG: hypothetical protein NTV49_02765 [Kiritimatiellaeota bacterium]|nr:hypothetical protein [Kiritimatiellota bacterium]